MMNLKFKTERLFDYMDEMLSDVISASGIGIIDMIDGVTDEEMKMIRTSAKLYKQSKQLALDYAEFTDELLERMEHLERTNDLILEKLEKKGD